MFTKMNGMQLLVRCYSTKSAQPIPLSGARIVGHAPQNFRQFAQCLFGVVALLHVQLVIVDVILQT